MSEIDTDKMIEMAREREGWRADGSSIANNGGFIAEACYRQDAPFIAHAPRTILAQAAHIATLEARLAAINAKWEAMHELDMGNHYVVHLEEFDALIEAITGERESPTAADGAESESE